MQHNDELFLKRYTQLNEKQKEAVDTIYGPVMVIAGPGTGKTEVLAMRIAALLRSEAQVKPWEILCLTFTEEGTVAMRKRLLQIIGEDAHRVHIYTFHAFCNTVIQSNPEYFGMRELMPISDLEKMDLLYQLIEHLPENHVLRRLKGNIFLDASNLSRLFDLMKSEDWSAEHLSEAIDLYLNDLPNREEFQYKRANATKNIKAGDPKTEDIRKVKDRMERTRGAALLFPEYQKLMARDGRYDFNDMILWVIRAFRERPDFLQIQQERFQFILADEFQDTSGAQSELLNMLAAYWEDPNLFIVGDDDQSIFEFQGARLQNIVDFYERYRESIKVIVLKENYRSTQDILDRATTSIERNNQRLIGRLSHLGLDKKIISSNERFKNEETKKPEINAYYNVLHEEADVVNRLEALQREGVNLSNTAVLYAQHRQAANIISLLEKKGIPYWVKKPVNILELPSAQQLLDVMRYIDKELTQSFSGEELLFRLMHTSFFGIQPLDIATLSLYLQGKDSKHKYWRFLLQDDLLLETMGLVRASSLSGLGRNLEVWIKEASSLTIPMLLERILYDGGIVASILKGGNPVWDMQVLNTFFDFIKEECAKNPRTTLKQLMMMIEKMETEKIPVSIQKVVRQENGVRFYTAFSAKGHEFEHVFLIGATKNFWEGKSGGNRGFSLPDTLTKTQASENEGGNTEEVARRLFYVAMTRAKKYLNISFAKKDNKEKDLETSRFIDEVSSAEERTSRSLDDAQVLDHLAASFLPDPAVHIAIAKKELLDKRLEQFVLSVSAMNKYLDCPLAFYYEYILRVPAAKSDALAFGSAVHYALEQLFKKMSAHPEKQFQSKEDMLGTFKYALRREEGAFTELQFKRRIELGVKILGEYYDHNITTFNKYALTEYRINNVSINGVPIKGNLDKIEFNGHQCVVIDYKTGNPEYSSRSELLPPSDKNPDGGDYWRQMVFYKLLLDNHPGAREWQMTAGIFEFIEKNAKEEFVRHTVPISDADITTVKQQVKEVYGKIMAHEFDTGCGKEDCTWCNFAKTYELSRPSEASDARQQVADIPIEG